MSELEHAQGGGFSIARVRETIERYGMLKGADGVLVGVSGGCDSVTLLHIMSFLSAEMGFRLEAAHINHHIRGAESDRDRDFVKSMCREYGVPLHILEADVAGAAWEGRISLEEAGRDIRYAFFEQEAERMGGRARVATAHTLSDSVETFLFNMARGTTIAGLCGIPPTNGRVIRPLIAATRQELEAFCAQSGIQYVTDSTNLTDEYARNRLRHHAVPALMEVNPAFERAFARLTASLSADRDFLAGEAETALAAARLSLGRYDGRALGGLRPAIAMRAAAALLEEFGFACDYARTAWLCGRFGGEDFKIELARDRYFEQRGGELFASVKPAAPRGFEERPLALGENPLFPGKTLTVEQIELESFEYSEKIHHWVLKNALKHGNIKGTLMLRTRREGDRINLGGATRTLKKLFSEAGMPADARAGAAVIADEDGPVWVEGFGCAKRVRAGDGDDALLIKIITNETSEGAAK